MQYYINKNTMLIENYRFPQFFIRRTKKAYISIINETILDLARNSGTLHSYNSLASGIKRDNSIMILILNTLEKSWQPNYETMA
jgi:hypothetical protein